MIISIIIITLNEADNLRQTILSVKSAAKISSKITVGVDFFTKHLTIGEDQVILQLWDFGGQERFRFLLNEYVKGTNGALIMFDLNRPSSFTSIPEWINLFKSRNPAVTLLLVGTKLDLINGSHRVLNDNNIIDLCTKYGCDEYIKVSSKTGENVKDLFDKIANLTLKKQMENFKEVS